VRIAKCAIETLEFAGWSSADRGDEPRVVGQRDGAAEAVDGVADRGEEPSPLIIPEQAVIAVRTELRQPLLGGVVLDPLEGAQLLRLERTRVVDPLEAAQLTSDTAEATRPAVLGEVLGVDLVEGRPHRGVVPAHVPERREASARPQHVGRLPSPAMRVDPVPRLARDDEVETATGVVPALEGRHLDGEPVAAGDHRHAWVEFDTEHVAATLGEEPAGLARAAPDVEHAAGCGRHELVDELVGIRRPRSVVGLGVFSERTGARPVLVNSHARRSVGPYGCRVTSVVERIAPARLGRSFRWLLGAFWVSNLGDGIGLAAGPLLVASQTRDPFLVALAVVLQRLPWLLFGLLAGVVADRFDRRRIIIGVQFARAAVLTVLSATIVLDSVDIAVVLVAMFLLGTAETFADTTASTLLPMIIEKRDLGIGNARIMAGLVTLNQLAGPPVGAALFAAGAVVPFVTQAAAMIASAVMASRIALPPHGVEKAARSHVRREIAEGFRWLWHNDAVRTLAITIVTFNVTYGAAWSVLVLYAIERLDTGEVGFGLLTTAGALGGVVGTSAYGWLTSRVRLGDLMRAGLIIETLTHLALALTTTAWVALLILFVFGAHAFVWGTTSTSVRQRAVPTELQGRVSSVYLIGVQGGIVVGSVLGGAIAGVWGVTAPFWFAFVGSGVLLVLIWTHLAHIAHADEAQLRAADVPTG
jgi:MFS family permease